MIWILHFVTITLFLIISKYKNNDEVFIRASFFYALFIFGQRWMTGTDFPYYLKYYLIDFEVQEKGYYFMQKFLATNNLYFGLLIFVVFFITLFNNYKFIKKMDRHVVLILYLYLISELFFIQLSQIRQFVAVSFFINAFFYSYQKEQVKMFFSFILGLLFHTSIVFLFPFLFIKIKLDRIKLLYLLLISSVLPLLNFSALLNIDIFSRYSHYLDSIFNVQLSFFHYIKFYVILGFIMLFVWNIEKFKNTKIEQMILNGLLFNMLLYGLSFQFALFLRVSYYFKIFEIIFLVYYYREICLYSISVMKWSLISLFFGIYVGLAVTDPFLVTRYEFRSLRLYDTRSNRELRNEIEAFEESL